MPQSVSARFNQSAVQWEGSQGGKSSPETCLRLGYCQYRQHPSLGVGAASLQKKVAGYGAWLLLSSLLSASCFKFPKKEFC